MMKIKAILLTAAIGFPAVAAMAQDPRPGDAGYVAPPMALKTHTHFGSSPFSPPDGDDTTFVVDQAGGLDTGCTFRSGGPLVFDIMVDRVVGDVDKLLANGLISETAELRMPAFDVDFDAVLPPPFQPERDRLSFNGNVVPTEFLTGSNNVWKLNSFSVPIDWVVFPSDPGAGGTVTPEANQIRIDIDVANADELWCTAIDWASLEIEVVRPVVGVHGILSSGSIWGNVWEPELNDLGIPMSKELSMGNLDSIGNNAQKIANEVQASQDRWGVDKVNLVTHSKGGIDSRDFAENADSVDQLIQLGTPNAGSPLADAAQAGAVVLTGLLGTALINAIAGPAGIQLTTGYMAGYNLFHGSNPEVTYTAVAGDYDPDCFPLNPFCRPIERLLLSIAGPGDTIVPITSVHALGYTINRVFATSGADKEATHSGLHSSQRVFDQNRDRVTMKSMHGGTERTVTQGGVIAQGALESHPVPIDESGPVLFSLMHPSDSLGFELITPSGIRIDPAAAAANPDLEFDSGPILGGMISVYSVAAPELGVWTAEVDAGALGEPSMAYAVSAWLENPAVTLVGSFAAAAIHAGEDLVLLGTVRDSGAPLLGASVLSRVVAPDNSSFDVGLVDDGSGADATAGDGVYSGVAAGLSVPGTYRVAFMAEGTNPGTGAAFSREDFGLATVSASTSSIAGGFNDFGVDTNGNGLFDELVIDVDLTITDAAGYRLFGVLTDGAGNTHESNVLSALGPGANTVALSFDGGRIFDNRVDGPYQLSVLRLAEDNGADILPVDELLNGHTTQAYSYLAFEHTPIRLSGLGSAVGVDTDGNGLFDFLDVTVDVEVDAAGFYQWSAQLQDERGTELDFGSGAAFFIPITNSLSFRFSGEAIGVNGVDGPYFVTDLLVFGAGASLVAGNAFQTQPFLASEFEGFVADTTPPEISVTLDPSVLWPPNHRMIDVIATIVVTDDLDPNPTVTLASIISSESDDGIGDGATLNDVQGADFGTDDREFQLRAERSGTGEGRVYTVTYVATDAAGNSAMASQEVVVPHDLANKVLH